MSGFRPEKALPGPPRERWHSAAEAARHLGLGGARHAVELIMAGMLGEIADNGTSDQVRARAVHALADRPHVTDAPRGALVLRTALAQPERHGAAQRQYHGWSQYLPEPRLDAVQGFYGMPDSRAERVVLEQVPVVVTLKGFTVAAFLASSYERVSADRDFTGGIRFTVGTDAPEDIDLAAFHERRLQTPRGGPFYWLAPLLA